MKNKNEDPVYLKSIRFSLVLKLVIIAWSFYVSITNDSFSGRILYLVVAIVFAGFFIFQLSFYRDKTRGQK